MLILLTRFNYFSDLKAAELVFLVDETDDSNFDLVIKLMYNIVRLFQPGSVKVTVVGFGTKQRIIFKGMRLPKVKTIQTKFVTFRPAANKKMYIGRALTYTKNQVMSKLPRNTPRILITILQGSSDDGFQTPVNQLKGDGIKMLSIGRSC